MKFACLRQQDPKYNAKSTDRSFEKIYLMALWISGPDLKTVTHDRLAELQEKNVQNFTSERIRKTLKAGINAQEGPGGYLRISDII